MDNNSVTNISSNINNEITNSIEKFNQFEQDNDTFDNSLINIHHHEKSMNQTEQLLCQVMNENSILRENKTKLEEIIIDKDNILNKLNTKFKQIEGEINKNDEIIEHLKSDNMILHNLIQSMKKDQEMFDMEKANLTATNKHLEQVILIKIENEKKLLEDNQILNQLIQDLKEQLTMQYAMNENKLDKLNDSEADNSHSNDHECSSCEYLRNQLNAYIYLYGELIDQRNVEDISNDCSTHKLTENNKINNTRDKINSNQLSDADDQLNEKIYSNEQFIKSHSNDLSLTEYSNCNESSSGNDRVHNSESKCHHAKCIK
ncbi:unnamed protein product [Schistosoma turkestanicum]|nr:unnamed protein product [Schistosoma turkestanicum]